MPVTVQSRNDTLHEFHLGLIRQQHYVIFEATNLEIEKNYDSDALIEEVNEADFDTSQPDKTNVESDDELLQYLLKNFT